MLVQLADPRGPAQRLAERYRIAFGQAVAYLDGNGPGHSQRAPGDHADSLTRPGADRRAPADHRPAAGLLRAAPPDLYDPAAAEQPDPRVLHNDTDRSSPLHTGHHRNRLTRDPHAPATRGGR